MKGLLQYAVRQLASEAESPTRCCKVCGGDAALFDVVDFNKSADRTQYPRGLIGVPVIYRRCNRCDFIFTGFFDAFTPSQWTQYVYNRAYVDVDPDYLERRPRLNFLMITSLLSGMRDQIVGLDYGGGSGETTELLRKAGWNFDTLDPFGATSLRSENEGAYNFCSAIEVLEHLTDPVGALAQIVSRTNNGRLLILIGTVIHDGVVTPETRLSWWYAAPRNGHISLYSRKAMRWLARRFELDYVSITKGTHLLTRNVGRVDAHMTLIRGKALGTILATTLSR
jgi:hypothetical protein